MTKKDLLNSDKIREQYLNVYENTEIKISEIPKLITFNCHFVNNPFMEILGNSDEIYRVDFYDGDKLIHSSDLSCNMWTKAHIKYYLDWRITITNQNGDLIYDEKINLENKKVYIALDSKSLGDTIAWVPYIDEFRKKHNCELVVSTFWNNFFIETYPDIKFINPGIQVNDLYAMYVLGWFYDENSELELPNTIPLQKTASNILGLDYKEIKPILSYDKKNVVYDYYNKPLKDKYVTIAATSTAQLKFWNNKTGWKEVVKFLNDNGYRVINVSQEGCDIEGVEGLKDYSMKNTMNIISNSEFFIGLSSGLSWLAWALDTKVVMISNFTDENHEFTSNCIRITNKSVCNACWNKPEHKFDKGDWNWCPLYKGTDRQFECHTSITGEMVINELKKLI